MNREVSPVFFIQNKNKYRAEQNQQTFSGICIIFLLYLDKQWAKLRILETKQNKHVLQTCGKQTQSAL
jgi:hypothetical protein